ncbi:hypothetical protein CAOG_02612 [Capsaspora owczarzaki ATCC 30864]|uniref:hypothetical protein n=1 Tax=Capsaspora owczarzaki (strain ATCC 30864) TaxID=595528 RepID=UPI0001FE29E9|nr:hypothetical protein CAOG_02612 [Capsaspora owczarzaki ATCC 30864]|eukprot:XP_004349362.1 hypothetical protein CAOG_02612 [Capsaspora owczarzaki ATCC 30864]
MAYWERYFRRTTYTEMQRVLQTWRLSILRVSVLGLGLLASAVYYYREHIRTNVAEEVADVASRSLSGENVKSKAEEVSKLVVGQVLTDPNTLALATTFVQDLIAQPHMQQAVLSMLVAVINDPFAKAKLLELVQAVFAEFAAQESTQTLMADFFTRLFQRDDIKANLSILLQSALNDPAFVDAASVLATTVLTTPRFEQQVSELASYTAHQTLNDEAIKVAATSFAQAVLDEPALRQQGVFSDAWIFAITAPASDLVSLPWGCGDVIIVVVVVVVCQASGTSTYAAIVFFIVVCVDQATSTCACACTCTCTCTCTATGTCAHSDIAGQVGSNPATTIAKPGYGRPLPALAHLYQPMPSRQLPVDDDQAPVLESASSDTTAQGLLDAPASSAIITLNELDVSSAPSATTTPSDHDLSTSREAVDELLMDVDTLLVDGSHKDHPAVPSSYDTAAAQQRAHGDALTVRESLSFGTE